VTTLTEALTSGRGVERPFRCTEHEDHMASASVNVLKGVWFCFACRASGHVDKNKAPKVEELQQMMESEKIPRIYDEAFLELYDTPDYWLSRFPAWLCWQMQLGSDPFTGDATFPVHTKQGKLAGVGRRTLNGEPKYKYPHAWSAASSLFGMGGKSHNVTVLTLVEGAADASSITEVGATAAAVYGSGIHLPQYELIARCNPKYLLIGFDMDEAGERAAKQAMHDMRGLYAGMARVHWPKNDPSACAPDQRREALLEAVRRCGYLEDIATPWKYRVEQMQMNHREYEESA
jgi:DNA primase